MAALIMIACVVGAISAQAQTSTTIEPQHIAVRRGCFYMKVTEQREYLKAPKEFDRVPESIEMSPLSKGFSLKGLGVYFRWLNHQGESLPLIRDSAPTSFLSPVDDDQAPSMELICGTMGGLGTPE